MAALRAGNVHSNRTPNLVAITFWPLKSVAKMPGRPSPVAFFFPFKSVLTALPIISPVLSLQFWRLSFLW
jgi:hypothetical protein